MQIGLRAFCSAFPDLAHDVLAVFGGETGATTVEHRISATHQGTFVSAAGPIAATGRPVEWLSASVAYCDNGRTSSWRIYQEQLGIIGQMMDVSPALVGA